jgi:DNA-binding IclR family transcriptional regulator
MTGIDDSAPKRRAGIQSVEIGLNVLDALAGLGKPSVLSAVVQRCGLSPSQTHRYLASLIVAGMARQDAGGNYDLGPAAIRLGLGALSRTDAFQSVDQAMNGFAERTGRTILITALGPSGPTVVRWHAGSPPIFTSLTVGSVLPLLGSATGHVFLAFAGRQEIRPLIEKELLSQPDHRSQDLAKLREQVQMAGEARADSILIPGLHAICFPIFDLQMRPVLAATMLSVSTSEPVSADVEEELRGICATISAELGGRTPPPPP